MRRLIIAGCIALVYAAAAGSPADQAFTAGMQLAENKQWGPSLDNLERALMADADNIQYGSEYRQVLLHYAQTVHPKDGKVQDFDRSLGFFERLVAQNPTASNAYLNYGFAYVDKIPAAGAITQVILANTALAQFTRALELRRSWIGYYTRGVSYLFWPKIFLRAKLGVADLQEAIKMQKTGPRHAYYARAWVALGDGYWKIDDLGKARKTWKQGLAEFPDSAVLRERLSLQGDALKERIEDALDPNKRVDTNLKDLWATQ
jgi:tetratricopeptide (TPR) repeat protein